MTSVLQQFYAGLVIFITGGTGFMGKLLLLKLLQSCPDIGGIIVLLRERRGQSCQERLLNIISSPVSVTCVCLPIEEPVILFLGAD
jgi:fatty acyl-CoA reductase